MVIAVDFDDTLCSRNSQPGYRMGPPEPGAILSMKRLALEGHTLIVFTARNVQDPRVFKAVEDWCKYFDIPINGITNIKKPEFQVMIDNRALHFDDWPSTMSRLARMQNETTHEG